MLKKRRSRRVCYDWPSEIRKGHIKQFYNSTDWDILREQVLERDKHVCQFFIGKWNDDKHFPNEIKIIEAVYVHHIKPIKEYPELALDINNCVALSFLAHEIIEDRYLLFNHKHNKKETLIDEKW